METNDTHPLLLKEFGMIRHWCLWKEAWAEAKHAEQLMGLLHVAFDMEPDGRGDMIECFRFLLEVADGFAAYDELKKPEDYPTFGCSWGTLSPTGLIGEACQMRRTVATKAMQVLCVRALRFERTMSHHLTWRIFQPEIFEKLLWFFDDAERRAHGHNLSDQDEDRVHKAARVFVRELILGAWPFVPGRFGDPERPEDDRLSKMFAAARPRFVRMLFRMDMLELLVDNDKRWRDMGEAEMAVLGEAAKRRSSRNAAHGEYASRDEASCDGSRAAQILIVVEACRREEARRARIADAERRQRKAQLDLETARK